MKSGHVTVSRAAIGADCLVRADKALIDGIARGEVNATAALLRGELTAVGDLELLMVVQRLFPGPPGSQRGERSPMGRGDDDELVKILDGNTFVVSDARGDIEASPTDPMGLFSFDTRFLVGVGF